MASESWWAEKVQENLSQGDIVTNLPFLIPTSPLKYLKHENLRGNRPGWSESATPVPLKDGRVQIVGLGKSLPGIVISHDCELDKARDKPRVILAAVLPMSAVAPEQHPVILEQRHRAYLPLPDLPSLGTCFANLRMIVTLDRDLVTKMPAIASMTEAGKTRLRGQLVEFFLRLTPEQLD